MKLLKRDPDKGYLDTWLWVPKNQINLEGTKRALTFTFVERESVTTLSLWKEVENHLLVPRAFWDPAEVNFKVVDARFLFFPSTNIQSHIQLDFLTPEETVQRDAVEALQKANGGILQLSCGKGKSIVALELITRMKVPALIIVDNTQLLLQWRDLILGKGGAKGFLALTPEEVGLIQAEVFDWKKPIVLATYQTLANRAEFLPEEVRRWFGIVIWDEGHHLSAPTFSKTADLFHGYRLGLTATPKRRDGLHIIYDFHLGKVVFKDLKQELKPRIYFMWTGLDINNNNALVAQKTRDKNGELHISKLSTFFGQWRERLDLILTEIEKAVAANRKILVLSNSVDALINMYALWTNYPKLYTDIPVPTEVDVGEVIPPMALDETRLKAIYRVLPAINAQLTDKALNPVKRQNLEAKKKDLEHAIKAHKVSEKVAAELRIRQKKFLKELLEKKDQAGLMIYKVKPEVRAAMLRTKQVTFAVMKYGREGLDEQSIDTIIVCEPMSSRNNLQQVMGRALRKKSGKKSPMIIFFEDNIGPMIGMCQNLRRHLREWSSEEGGPFEYEMVGYPRSASARAWTQGSIRSPGKNQI